MKFETQNELVKRYYDLLSILDNKASSLLMFNSIFLAVITVWLGDMPMNLEHFALDMIFLFLLVSCASLLLVIFLDWKEPEDWDRAELENVVGQMKLMRTTRSSFYYVSWGISLLCIVLVGAISLIDVFTFRFA